MRDELCFLADVLWTSPRECKHSGFHFIFISGLWILWHSSEWFCVLVITKIIHCFFSVHYCKTFWNSSCFNRFGNGREWKLLFSFRDFPRPGTGMETKSREREGFGTRKSFPHMLRTMHINSVYYKPVASLLVTGGCFPQILHCTFFRGWKLWVPSGNIDF